jgi:anti-sigma regulatory factor (Ser/Thr protein kinase)
MSDRPAGAWAEDEVRMTVASHPRHLPLVRALVERGAAEAGFSADESQRISLAVTEGVTNVIRHGYHGATNQRIDLRLRLAPGSFRLEIEDYGRFVDPAAIRSRPLEDVRPGGLGVHLMKATMDTVDYARNEHGGTTLTLTRQMPVGEESS